MVTEPELARTWSAPIVAVALGAVATLALGAWAVAVPDPPGRLLVGLGALALLGVTVVGGLGRPRLAADTDGLVLRGPLGRRGWPWDRVDAVRVVRLRRLGIPGGYLEIDARDDDGDETLLVLGRLELGTDPVDVAAALQEHRARAGRRRNGGTSESERGQGRHPDTDEHDEDGGNEPGQSDADRRA